MKKYFPGVLGRYSRKDGRYRVEYEDDDVRQELPERIKVLPIDLGNLSDFPIFIKEFNVEKNPHTNDHDE